MSYSFTVTADTKDDAGQKVADELALVVASQPSHEADRQAAQDAAEGFIDVLAEPGVDECVSVTVYGSLSWRSDNDFVGADVTVRASLKSKAPDA